MRLFGIKIYVSHFVSFRELNRHEQVKPVQMFSRAIADHAGLGFTLRSWEAEFSNLHMGTDLSSFRYEFIRKS